MKNKLNTFEFRMSQTLKAHQSLDSVRQKPTMIRSNNSITSAKALSEATIEIDTTSMSLTILERVGNLLNFACHHASKLNLFLSTTSLSSYKYISYSHLHGFLFG